MHKLKSVLVKCRNLLYRKGVGNFKGDAKHYLDALDCAKNKNFKAAIESLEKAVSENPSNDKAYALLINYSLKRGNRISVEQVTEITNKFENSVYVDKEAANYFFKKKNYEKAFLFQKKVVRNYPDNLKHKIMLARYKYSLFGKVDVDELESLYFSSLKEKLDINQLMILLHLAKSSFSLNVLEGVIRRIKGFSDTLQQNHVREVSKSILLTLRYMNKDVDLKGDALDLSFENRFENVDALENCFSSYYDSLIFEGIRGEGRASQKRRSVNRQHEKILLVSDNWNFLNGYIEELEQSKGLEVRTLVPSMISDFSTFQQHLPGGLALGHAIPCDLRNIQFDTYWGELLDWCDVVFVEWANNSAIWISWLKNFNKKIVLRVHSYEAFSYYPCLINWENIDDIVFVAPHIEKVFSARYLDKHQPDNKPTIHLIPNYNELNSFLSVSSMRSLKEGCARLAMVGYNTANKNPIFAVEILLSLLDRGVHAKLSLVGHEWSLGISEEEQAYKEKFFALIEKYRLHEHISFKGFTDNLPAILKNSDFIISGSRREGTHESVLQAMASGCVPVIYDWPLVKPWGGARDIYGDRWVVNDVAEAVDKVSKLISLKDALKNESEEVKQFSVSRFSSEMVAPRLTRVLLSGVDA